MDNISVEAISGVSQRMCAYVALLSFSFMMCHYHSLVASLEHAKRLAKVSDVAG